MLDDKRLNEIRKNVPLMLNEGSIDKKEENKKLISFYLDNALVSLNAARILYEVSNNNILKRQFKFVDDTFEAYLWVVNPSYYSMFYMASALLASEGIKIRSEIGIHKKTFEALVYYFYLTNRLPKRFLEIFEEAQQESQELLGKEEIITAMKEKSLSLMKKYEHEMGKRSTFTYNMGEKAKQGKANTSLTRAREFYQEVRKVLEIKK